MPPNPASSPTSWSSCSPRSSTSRPARGIIHTSQSRPPREPGVATLLLLRGVPLSAPWFVLLPREAPMGPCRLCALPPVPPPPLLEVSLTREPAQGLGQVSSHQQGDPGGDQNALETTPKLLQRQQCLCRICVAPHPACVSLLSSHLN